MQFTVRTRVRQTALVLAGGAAVLATLHVAGAGAADAARSGHVYAVVADGADGTVIVSGTGTHTEEPWG